MPPKKAFKKGCRKNDKSNYERRPAWQEHTPANQNFEAYYKVLYTSINYAFTYFIYIGSKHTQSRRMG